MLMLKIASFIFVFFSNDVCFEGHYSRQKGCVRFPSNEKDFKKMPSFPLNNHSPAIEFTTEISKELAPSLLAQPSLQYIALWFFSS